MATRFLYLAILAIWIAALWFGLDFAGQQKQPKAAIPTTQVDWTPFFEANILPSLPIADEFDTPLRPPDGAGVVDSLPYLGDEAKMHLGEDWTTAKGDAALGEPVYSVADGWVAVAFDFANAWGKAVFIDYRLPDGRYPPYVEVMYAQLDSMTVTAGQFVKRGQQIGTVGNAQSTYVAHLHWEVRTAVGIGPGLGYDSHHDNRLGPSEFLAAHRGDRFKQPLQMRTLTPEEAAKPKRDGWGNDD
jgi:murein DD-endopeptidase MepM/ murein hydrolase activator NlpD